MNETEDRLALEQAIKAETEYNNSKHYTDYLNIQTEMNWINRAEVLIWMMELATDLNCRRESFGNSVNILDRYLGLSKPISKKNLQLLGCACLLISEKLENNNPQNTYDFYCSISQVYTLQDLLQFELLVAKTLNFKLRAPTINSWANRLCNQWDLYVQHKNSSFQSIRFKTGDVDSYINFRWLTQYIDFSLLDIRTLQYKNRTLAAAFLYLTIMLKLQIYSEQYICSTFKRNSAFIREETPFNVFFNDFLMYSFNFPLEEIQPTVQYCSMFVLLPLNFDEVVIRDQKKQSWSFEEYLGLQTCNTNFKVALNRIDRSFW